MTQKKKKTVRHIIIGIGLLWLIIIIAALVLFRNELRSLMSLEKVDKYGMYQMTYYGDYGFDEFLEVGARNDADIEAFVTKDNMADCFLLFLCHIYPIPYKSQNYFIHFQTFLQNIAPPGISAHSGSLSKQLIRWGLHPT